MSSGGVSDQGNTSTCMGLIDVGMAFASDQATVSLIEGSAMSAWLSHNILVNVVHVEPREGPLAEPLPQERAVPRPAYARSRRTFDDFDLEERLSSLVPYAAFKTFREALNAARPPDIFSGKVFAPEGASNFEHSVFATRQRYFNSSAAVQEAVRIDIQHCCRGRGLEHILPSHSNLGNLVDLLVQHYTFISSMHRWYSSLSKAFLFAMSEKAFQLFLNKTGIFASENTPHGAPTISGQQAHIIFSASEQGRTGDAHNVGKALDRHEFTEALVRTSFLLYPSSSETSVVTADVAMKKLLSTYLYPHADRASNVPFRERFLYTKGTDVIFREHMLKLKSVYIFFADKFSHGSARHVLNLQEWMELASAAFSERLKKPAAAMLIARSRNVSTARALFGKSLLHNKDQTDGGDKDSKAAEEKMDKTEDGEDEKSMDEEMAMAKQEEQKQEELTEMEAAARKLRAPFREPAKLSLTELAIQDRQKQVRLSFRDDLTAGTQSSKHKSTFYCGLQEVDFRQAFSFSQLMYTDEMSKEKSDISFATFLEAVARIAHSAYFLKEHAAGDLRYDNGLLRAAESTAEEHDRTYDGYLAELKVIVEKISAAV